MKLTIPNSNRTHFLIVALTAVLTLVLVRLPLPFLYGIELLFFTTVSWFVYLRYSLQNAVLLTIVGAACGIFLWDQSPLLALYPIEIMLVGWISSRSKRSVVFWDAVYWLTFGVAGFYVMNNWLTGTVDFTTVITLLFVITNSLMNVFFGKLTAEYWPDRRSGLRTSKRQWRIGRIIYHLCLTLLIVPTLIYILISGHFTYQRSLSDISTRLDTIYSHVEERFNNLTETELRDLKVRSTLQKASLTTMFVNLTAGTDIQLTLIDANRHIVASLDASSKNEHTAYDWTAGGTVRQLTDSLSLWQPDDIPAYNKVNRWSRSEFVSVYSFERLPYTLIAKQPATTFQQDMFQLYLLSLLLVGISILVSATIAYQFTKRLSAAITELGEYSTGLPRRIRLREPIEWKDSPLYEVDILKNNFEDMSKELAGMFHEINQSEEKLRVLVHYDPLTGLGNRYSFSLYLPSLIQEARLRKSRIACLFIDLDHFKSINDTYGHEAGDAVIKEVGARLKRYNTGHTKAFRLSGDEFVVVMSEPLPDDLETWAQEIHDVLISDDIQYQDQRIRTALSAGVSLYPDHGEDAESLLRNSDRAMYQAKVHGRNRVRFSSGTNADILKGGEAE